MLQDVVLDMHSLMLAICFLFIYFVLPLFVCLVLPLRILIDCARSALSRKTKTRWIVFMVLVWPIGSLIYGLFVSKSRLLRLGAGVALLLLLLFAVGIISWMFLVHPQ